MYELITLLTSTRLAMSVARSYAAFLFRIATTSPLHHPWLEQSNHEPPETVHES